MIHDKLESDLSVRECPKVTIDYLMEMLTFCLLTIYFQLSSDIYWKEEGLLMGSPLSPIMGNIQRIFWWKSYGNIITKTNHVAYLHTLVPLGRCADTAGPCKTSIQFTKRKEAEDQMTFMHVHRVWVQDICMSWASIHWTIAELQLPPSIQYQERDCSLSTTLGQTHK